MMLTSFLKQTATNSTSTGGVLLPLVVGRLIKDIAGNGVYPLLLKCIFPSRHLIFAVLHLAEKS